MRIIILFLFMLLQLLGCNNNFKKSNDIEVMSITLPYFDTPDFTPKWQQPEHKITDFLLVNQNGDSITNATYYGKIYVANFFFTICPGICPKLESNMSILQDHYKNDEDIMLVSHTVMPWIDDVNQLNSYGLDHNIDKDKWHLLTGNKNELYDLARFGYFADGNFLKTQSEDDFIHTENFVLVDKLGYIRGVYNGTIPLDIKRLIRHITRLKKSS